MKPFEKNINELTIPDFCKRHHSKSQISRCVRSLKKHGQYQPIVISDNDILCGVLVYLASKQIGKDKIWAVDLGHLSEEKKKEIRYLDNQIFDIEDWDEERIKSYLMELDVSKLKDIAFTQEEAEQFINLESEETARKARIDQIWECDSCGWSGKIKCD